MVENPLSYLELDVSIGRNLESLLRSWPLNSFVSAVSPWRINQILKQALEKNFDSSSLKVIQTWGKGGNKLDHREMTKIVLDSKRLSGVAKMLKHNKWF